MAQEFLVTGNKYNKNVRIILGSLLVLIVSGLILISGWKPSLLPQAKSVTPSTSVTELTTDVLSRSKFVGPYLINVVRANGSYSFAKIENGEVGGDKLIGLTEHFCSWF